MSFSRNNKSCAPVSNEAWTLLIGEISAPQGLHGEARIYPQTDFPERFSALTEVGVQRGAEPAQVMRVEAVHYQGRRIVIKLAGINTIEQVEALRGARLVIPPSWAMPLGDDEYYHHQLLGLDVVTTAGASLGKITAIWPTGANDVYETPLALIPAVKEFVREVDLAQGRMLVEERLGLRKQDPAT